MSQGNARTTGKKTGRSLFEICSTHLLLLLCVVTVVGCTYGPPRDRSKFVSTHLLEDGNTVLFSAHQFVVRPATGIAAFPDGGISKVVKDRNFIGFYDIQNEQHVSIFKERNTEFAKGQGNYYIQHVIGSWALVGQGGQTRSASERGDYKTKRNLFLVNHETREMVPLLAVEELASRGRDLGTIQALGRDGSLVFLCPSLEEAKANSNWNREKTIVPEIWIRKPDGSWLKAGASRHFEQYIDGTLVWWEPSDRLFRIFHVADERLTLAQRWDNRSGSLLQSIREGVSTTDSGRTLTYGQKEESGWQYSPLPLTVDQLF